jgi:hypothetical protein
LGAVWDPQKKKWYLPENQCDLQRIYSWRPPEEKIVYQRVDLSDNEIVRKFASLKSRFKTGQEVLSHLGLSVERLEHKHFFCTACDSNSHGWCVFGNMELHHVWQINEKLAITQKEEYLLVSYLDSYLDSIRLASQNESKSPFNIFSKIFS